MWPSHDDSRLYSECYNLYMSLKKHKVRAISICGGGIKGIIPAYLIMEMEKILQEITGRDDERIVNYIDLFSGTSVGGILSVLYLAPIDSKGTLRSAKEIYQKIIECMTTVFYETPNGSPAPAPEYSSAKAREYYSDLFKELQLKDLAKSTLITAYEPNRHWMSFFRQQHAIRDPAANFLLRDVCLATGAMPIYFDPVIINSFSEGKVSEHSFMHQKSSETLELIQMLKDEKIINEDRVIQIEMNPEKWSELKLPEKWLPQLKAISSTLERIRNPSFTFVDGVIFANNPSSCTLIEIGQMDFEHLDKGFSKVKNSILISLGTGIDESRDTYSGTVNAKFATRLMNMLFSCSESLSHYQCMLAYAAVNASNQYHYLNPVIKPLPGKTLPSCNFYDTRADNVKALQDLAAAYTETQRPLLKEIVHDLIKEIEE